MNPQQKTTFVSFILMIYEDPRIKVLLPGVSLAIDDIMNYADPIYEEIVRQTVFNLKMIQDQILGQIKDSTER